MNNRKQTRGRHKHNMKVTYPITATNNVYKYEKVKEVIVKEVSEVGNEILVKKEIGLTRKTLWLKGQIIKFKTRIVNINVNRT